MTYFKFDAMIDATWEKVLDKVWQKASPGKVG